MVLAGYSELTEAVIASEAKQSSPAAGAFFSVLIWIATSALQASSQ
jgi:hypothetical protein